MNPSIDLPDFTLANPLVWFLVGINVVFGCAAWPDPVALLSALSTGFIIGLAVADKIMNTLNPKKGGLPWT